MLEILHLLSKDPERRFQFHQSGYPSSDPQLLHTHHQLPIQERQSIILPWLQSYHIYPPQLYPHILCLPNNPSLLHWQVWLHHIRLSLLHYTPTPFTSYCQPTSLAQMMPTPHNPGWLYTPPPIRQIKHHGNYPKPQVPDWAQSSEDQWLLLHLCWWSNHEDNHQWGKYIFAGKVVDTFLVGSIKAS